MIAVAEPSVVLVQKQMSTELASDGSQQRPKAGLVEHLVRWHIGTLLRWFDQQFAVGGWHLALSWWVAEQAGLKVFRLIGQKLKKKTYMATPPGISSRRLSAVEEIKKEFCSTQPNTNTPTVLSSSFVAVCKTSQFGFAFTSLNHCISRNVNRHTTRPCHFTCDVRHTAG